MTINLEPLLKTGIPKYLAIAEALEEAIARGELPSGTRLPTHRELAEQLKVSVQTVSNAYAHAEKQGVIKARVGSGTFVSEYGADKETELMLADDTELDGKAIDLSIAHPVCTPELSRLFGETLVQIGEGHNEALIRAMRPVQGLRPHLEAAARWLEYQKMPVEPERILLCNGASQGLTLALEAVLQPGDWIACEELVDHGLIARSRMLHTRLLGLPVDREGIIPEALEEACRRRKIRVLCCTPSMSNPGSSHMGAERRQAIAELARRYHLMVIEDDVYGALEPERQPPLSSLLPEQSFYVTSLTKVVAPGLRCGFMVPPRHLMQHCVARLASSSWMATPLGFEVASRWMDNGTLVRLVAFQQQEFAARQQLARERLSGFEYDCHPFGMHLWLRLPEGWQADQLVASARQANMLITGYQPFVVEPETRLGRVRISLGVESRRQRVGHGLQLLADMLNAPPPPTHFLL
ncbi:PLP-dependent aminotransferase family protein [Zobellella taiwanensis]|jgi:DNA-binding transcriptional MocR family regulator|uniref:MocR-like ectoine utilization transcription factor EhuR n=1 Tax=Zobellella taiwanensis TaxID=347535 RepID=UPI0015E6767A|nr:PLP-dependent aminotransferase family protein [Zobellella taiwanensis]